VTLAFFMLPALAADETAALLLPSDIVAAAKPGFQGVSTDTIGAVHYPDVILAFPITQTSENRELLTAWGASYRFYVVPLEVGVAPPAGFTPDRFNLSLTFPGLGQPARQILVIDTFPKTSFAPGAVSGNATVKLGADLKFADVVPVNPSASADASLSVKYAPAYANVISGYGSSSAFWQFSRTQDKYPAGDVPVKLVLAVPRAMAGQSVTLSADVRIEYSGPWWQKGLAVTSLRTRVNLPPAR
jgi:hypothetical protein